MNATLVVCLLLLPSPRSIRSLSARESRNRVPLLAAPAGQDTATHPRTFTRPPQSSYLQLESNQRVGGAFLLQPPFPAAQPAAGMFFTQNPLSPPFLWPDLTNQGITGGSKLKRKPNFLRRLLDKRNPHCRHQLSLKNSLSLTIVQKKSNSNVAREEVSAARELGESLRHTGSPVAGCWQRTTPAPTPLHPSPRTPLFRCQEGPRQLARKKPDYLPERQRWISLQQTERCFLL